MDSLVANEQFLIIHAQYCTISFFFLRIFRQCHVHLSVIQRFHEKIYSLLYVFSMYLQRGSMNRGR